MLIQSSYVVQIGCGAEVLCDICVIRGYFEIVVLFIYFVVSSVIDIFKLRFYLFPVRYVVYIINIRHSAPKKINWNREFWDFTFFYPAS